MKRRDCKLGMEVYSINDPSRTTRYVIENHNPIVAGISGNKNAKPNKIGQCYGVLYEVLEPVKKKK